MNWWHNRPDFDGNAEALTVVWCLCPFRMVWYDVTQLWEPQTTFHLRYWNPKVEMATMAESATGGQWECSFTKCLWVSRNVTCWPLINLGSETFSTLTSDLPCSLYLLVHSGVIAHCFCTVFQGTHLSTRTPSWGRTAKSWITRTPWPSPMTATYPTMPRISSALFSLTG